MASAEQVAALETDLKNLQIQHNTLQANYTNLETWANQQQQAGAAPGQQHQPRGKGGKPPSWGKNEKADTTWTSFLARFNAWARSERCSEDESKSYLYQSDRKSVV